MDVIECMCEKCDCNNASLMVTCICDSCLKENYKE